MEYVILDINEHELDALRHALAFFLDSAPEEDDVDKAHHATINALLDRVRRLAPAVTKCERCGYRLSEYADGETVCGACADAEPKAGG